MSGYYKGPGGKWVEVPPTQTTFVEDIQGQTFDPNEESTPLVKTKNRTGDDYTGANYRTTVEDKSSKGMSTGAKVVIGVVAFLIVATIIVLSVLGGLGYFSKSDETNTDKKCQTNATRNSSGACVCNTGYIELSNNGTVSCIKNTPCPPGTSGEKCMIVDTLPGGTVITTNNGYSACNGNGLVWNGYECLDTNKITSCPLAHTGNVICGTANDTKNVYWLHDSASTDKPYQCYNGTDNDGRVFGSVGSYAEPTDRCMFGVGGATSQTACSALKTALKC